jgi:hypothetical protein
MVEEGAQICPACKTVLNPMVQRPLRPSLIKTRSLKSRIVEWSVTAVLVLLGAVALQRLYYGAGPIFGSVTAEHQLDTARGEIAAMSADERAVFRTAAEVCELGNQVALDLLMSGLAIGTADPAAVAQHCDEIGARMGRMGLMQ